VGRPLNQQEIAQVLAASSLFEALDEASRLRLARVCTQRHVERGHFLCHQGDRGDRIFVIAEGLVKVVITSLEGIEVVLATMGKNESLGELAVLDGSPRSASVIAVEPTQVVMLYRQALLGVMSEHPPVLDALLRSLGGTVRRLTEQTGDFVFLDLGGRVAKVLLRLSAAHSTGSGEPVIDLGLTQSDLAAMVGASRPAVNRALQMLAVRGWITINGQAIVLHDPEALARRAGL
jgi:CRP-like cAMP-binding protein